MLIDFTVENYRSIKEPVTLSAVAQAKTGRGNGDAKRKGIKPDDEIAPPFLVPNRKLELLPVLGIFGANASGKSNVIRALEDLLVFLSIGINFANATKWIVPFKLDSVTSEDATKFIVRSVHEGSIFVLTIKVSSNRVLLERLESIPYDSQRSNRRLLFERFWDFQKDAYTWYGGPGFTAFREVHNVIGKHTPFTGLIINSTQNEEINSWRNWFTNRWHGSMLDLRDDVNQIEERSLVVEQLPEMLKAVSEFVQQFDTGIMDIHVEESDNRIWVLHKSDAGIVRWPIEEESTGTQNLFLLAYKIIRTLDNGSLLLADELGSNIHPNITRAIVRLFQNPETNPKRAQLIFTSHDNTLQRGNLLRRDQIWFTQKRADGSTDLYPLTDFHPRNDLALDKAYLDGRFGAVPLLPSDEELLASTTPAGAAS